MISHPQTLVDEALGQARRSRTGHRGRVLAFLVAGATALLAGALIAWLLRRRPDKGRAGGHVGRHGGQGAEDDRSVIGERLDDGLTMMTVGHGEPVVYLPPLGEGVDLSARVPAPEVLVARALARTTRRRVHTIARPVSPRPGMTLSELADVYALAIERRFGGPVDVVGLSAGGVTGLELALDRPEAVRRLAVVAAASRVSAPGRQGLLDSVRHDGHRFGAAYATSSLLGHGLERAAIFTALLLLGSHPRAAGELAMIDGAQRWDVTDRLDGLTVPTLLVGGTRDALFPRELIEATAHGVPGARLVTLPGRGHLTTMLDRRTLAAVAAFLDDD